MIDRLGERSIPLLLPLVAVVFNLVVLRHEVMSVLAANDTEQHLIMVNWANDRIAAGNNPFDGWYSYLAFGSPHFHHYQSLPHIVTGAVGVIVGPITAYFWSTYLLVSLWPLCVYVSGRLFGASRWVSGVAGLVCLLVVSTPPNAVGYEFGAYSRGGYGVFPQLWGMWLLPIALALTWRALEKRGSYLWPAATLAVLFASHYITAFLAVAVLGVWTLVRWKEFTRRLLGTLLVGVGAVGVGAFSIVPPLSDTAWSGRIEGLIGNDYTNSYGLGRVLRWLVSGAVFDYARVPVITAFVFAGLVACIVSFRKDVRARALVLFFVVSVVLYSGRSLVAFVLDFLPGGDELLLHRYIIGLHLSGIFLAGVGASWIGARAVREVRHVLPRAHIWLSGKRPPKTPFVPTLGGTALVATLVGMLLLMPAASERARWASLAAGAIEAQAVADRWDGRQIAELADIAKRRGGGRISGGGSGSFGDSYRIGSVTVYSALARYKAEQVGYVERTFSLLTSVERSFNDTVPAHVDLFNVRYFLRPENMPQPRPPGSKEIGKRGVHVLLEAPTRGYIDIVDVYGTIHADRTDLGSRMAPWLSSPELDPKVLPAVAFGGERALGATTAKNPPKSSPGKVLSQRDRSVDGMFSARVNVKRRAVVLLKATFDPRWRILIDGKRAEPRMIAPAFVGAEVGPGKHDVSFVYEPLSFYPQLFLLSLLSIAAFAFVPRLLARRRSSKRASDGSPGPVTIESS